MFFFLSKTLDLALSPLTWAMALVAFGLVSTLRRREVTRAVRICLAAALLVLVVFSLEPVSNRLERSLEGAESTWRADATYDAVIVLGGMTDIHAHPAEQGETIAFNDGAERLLAGYQLLRTDRARHIVLTGGAPDPSGAAGTEAALAARQLERWGIASERIVLETKSRNTAENAAYTARIVKERGWRTLVLVTSDSHMERAAACFRAKGLEFDTLPVDSRSYDPAKRTGRLLPRAENLWVSTRSIREWVGRLVYRVRGC